MSKIKVSVIIPVYNAEKYLKECLDSVINQSLKEIEIICIDDGSTDNSLEILKEYVQNDNRIIVLQQKNSGAGVARNKGLKIAKGEYLSFLDSDDIFDEQMLMKSYCEAVKHNADIVMFRHDRYDEENDKFYRLPHMMNPNNFPKIEIFNVEDMESNFYFSIYGWTWDKLFKKTFIDNFDLKFQSVRIYNDMFFTYSAVVVASKIRYIEDYLLTQRVNRKGSITKSVQNNWYCIIDALKAVRDFLVDNDIYDKWRKYFSIYALHMILFTERQVIGDDKYVMDFILKKITLKELDIDINNIDLLDGKNEIAEIKQILLSVKNVNAYKCLELQKNNIQLQEELNKIKISESYKFGQLLTFIPRKIISGIKCYRTHGLKYTLNRVLVHLRLKK